MPRQPRRHCTLVREECGRTPISSKGRRAVVASWDGAEAWRSPGRAAERGRPQVGRKSMQIGWSILLIIHGILAVLLLGAITHQAIAAAWPAAKRAPGFFNSLRSVNGMSYTNAVVVLFVVTFVLGTIIYPTYRLNVRTVLQEYHLYKPE